MKINIRNLQIKYNDRQIAYINDLSFQSGELVLLTGHSGTGKSSVLKLLSLADDIHFDCDYFINDKNITSFKENKINRFKMRNIAYISQECLVFNEFTVLENLETFSQIGYNKVLKKKIDPLVNLLQLDKILNKKAKKLSGGERQRVAIACGVLKNADLYLFDEPTSMIDIDNKKAVLQLINSLAKQGKIVVVVTHEKQYFNADKEYFFEEGTAKLIKNNLSNQLVDEKDKKPSFNIKAFIKKMAQKIFISTPISNAVYVMMSALCISMIVATFNFCINNIQGHKETASIVNAPEIFVVNAQDVSTRRHFSLLFPIEVTAQDQIKALDKVKSVEPYFFFTNGLASYLLEKGLSEMTYTYPSTKELTLLKDGKIITTFDYEKHWREVRFPDASEHKMQLYAIFPTYPHQNLDKKCTSLYETEERGIYISKTMAECLNLTELNGESINLDFQIPIATVPCCKIDSLKNDEKTQSREELKVKANETFVIKGILERDLKNDMFEGLYTPDFFMDIATMKEIQKEYYEEYKDQITELSHAKQTKSHLIEYYDTVLLNDEMWPGSCLIVEVDGTSNIDEVADQIKKIDPGFYVAITDHGIPYIDTKLVNGLWNTAFIYSGIIFSILFLSLIIIKTFRRKRRRNDYQLFKNNGFTPKQMNALERYELLLETTLISIISIIFVILFIHFTNYRMMYPASFNIWCVVGVILLTSFTLYLANFISKLLKK